MTRDTAEACPREPGAIEHDTLGERFLLVVDGHLATLDYRLGDRRVIMLGVRVPTAIEGQGVAARLTAAAVGWAEAAGLAVLSQCSFVDAWLRRRQSQATGANR